MYKRQASFAADIGGRRCVEMWGKVRRSGDSRSAEGAEVERHRIEAPKAQSAPREVGCAPPQKIFFDF